MSRVDSWPQKLMAEVAAAESVPFQWGAHDCAIFAVRVELALTGKTRFADALGGYQTERGAGRKIHRLGFSNIEQLIDSRLDEILPAFAQRGDVVTVDSDHGAAVGIVLGADAVTPGPDGLTRYPVTNARRAWRLD